MYNNNNNSNNNNNHNANNNNNSNKNNYNSLQANIQCTIYRYIVYPYSDDIMATIGYQCVSYKHVSMDIRTGR